MQMKITEQNTTSEPVQGTQGPITATINISDIAVREDWQVRNKLDQTTVNAYRAIYKNGGTLPPIQVAQVAGVPRLVDGWHRLAALKLLQIGTVDATIFPATMTEARWAAATANFTHGLPLKPKEVRNVFNAYITARRHYAADGWIKSYRDMEDDLGNRVSYRTLNNWMQKDHPKIAKAMAEQYGEEDKARYDEGDAPPPAYTITALDAAKASLDNVLAEARSMPPEDREALLAHAKDVLGGIVSAAPWVCPPPERENPDF